MATKKDEPDALTDPAEIPQHPDTKKETRLFQVTRANPSKNPDGSARAPIVQKEWLTKAEALKLGHHWKD